MTRSRIWVGTACIAVAATAAGAAWHRGHAPRAREGAVPVAAATAPARIATSLFGERRRYDARLETRVSISPGELASSHAQSGAGAPSFAQDISGTLAELALDPAGTRSGSSSKAGVVVHAV